MHRERRRIVIATANPGKFREISAVMADLPIDWVPLSELPPIEEPVEDGETFAENARLKALYYAKATGLWALADDSGLEIDALGGAPGVYSARYAGEPCDDAANNARIVRELAGVPAEGRTARFRCAIALASEDHTLAEADGKIEGVIIDEARGQNGFGYDPHFFVPSLGKTTAEITPEHKNSISHRGNALRAIRPAIERCVRTESA
ncbi:MAG: XTP/dITP diphosphatase [Phycisphaerae bacterium]|nr:XTP/dITP diphosphatase [Phycisphaerae bacterium]